MSFKKRKAKRERFAFWFPFSYFRSKKGVRIINGSWNVYFGLKGAPNIHSYFEPHSPFCTTLIWISPLICSPTTFRWWDAVLSKRLTLCLLCVLLFCISQMWSQYLAPPPQHDHLVYHSFPAFHFPGNIPVLTFCGPLTAQVRVSPTSPMTPLPKTLPEIVTKALATAAVPTPVSPINTRGW